jgi:hypothetical protein
MHGLGRLAALVAARRGPGRFGPNTRPQPAFRAGAGQSHTARAVTLTPKGFVMNAPEKLALRLDADSRIAAYQHEAENFESIHNHSACAVIIRDKRPS